MENIKKTRTTKIKTYSVSDIHQAECTLDPMICIYCQSDEVTYNTQCKDAYCSDCGEWQSDDE